MRKLFLSFAAFLAAAPSALGADPCTSIPDVARDYLKAHPEWSILKTSNLIDDDKQLWRQYHKAVCPGLAEVDLDGSGKRFIGLALIRTTKSAQEERVIIVRTAHGKLETRTIYSDFKVPPYTVIWRAPPGVTWEWDQPDRKIHLPYDSLIAETLESAAQQFYLKNGKLVYVQTSD